MILQTSLCTHPISCLNVDIVGVLSLVNKKALGIVLHRGKGSYGSPFGCTSLDHFLFKHHFDFDAIKFEDFSSSSVMCQVYRGCLRG